MKNSLAITYNDDWIIENYFNYANTKMLLEEYNKKFSTSIGYSTFKSHCNREMKMNGMRADHLYYSQEEKDFILSNYQKYGADKTRELFNKQFEQNVSLQAIKVFCVKHGVKVCEKSKKQNMGQKKRKHNVGDIWLGGDGFLHICITEKYHERKDMYCHPRYHRYLWEKTYGEIPKGYKVIFLDGNVMNCELSNLCMVPASYLALMNKNKLKSNNKYITRAGVKWCDLYTISKLKEGVTNDNY